MAKSSNKRFFTQHAKSSAVLISLIIHAVLIFVALSVVVVTVAQKEAQVFVAQEIKHPRMKLRKLTVPVNIGKKKIQNPKMQKRIAVKHELKTVAVKLPEMTGIKWGLGFLDTGGGLDGLDLGLSVNFFGISGGGTHIAFIIDYSASMWGEREKIMRREAARVIRELPRGTQFGVIFFGGPAWPAGLDPKLSDWVKTSYDAHSFRPKDWNDLPKVTYKEASMFTTSSMIRKVKTTPLVDGTVYDCPIYMALNMEPIPDTIFFMTDGGCTTNRGIVSLRKMVDQLTATGKKVPVMHTIGFGISSDAQLKEMAELMRGRCRFLTAREYIKTYGRDESRPAKLDPQLDVRRKVETVPFEAYPIEFSLR
jgi:hypothetical protein